MSRYFGISDGVIEESLRQCSRAVVALGGGGLGVVAGRRR
jgi:hypothetical protein